MVYWVWCLLAFVVGADVGALFMAVVAATDDKNGGGDAEVNKHE